MGKQLRSGFTTGACATAAAKAAAAALLTQEKVSSIEVLFPDRSTVTFEIIDNRFNAEAAFASVIKDAGDDPDVTNGALIQAEVRFKSETDSSSDLVEVKGGEGVGMVTKPGLAVEVGNPAINPVPMQMIKENVGAAMDLYSSTPRLSLEVVIHVPKGVELARKTLNERLGIIGGISILGTTGIVRPVSAEAWTATIQSSMSVAEANGVKEIILSTGRTSEKCIEQALQPKAEALVMMGDYLEFSLKEVRNYSFAHVHVATMWAKLLKGVMGYPQTHVRHGILETEEVCTFFTKHHIGQALIDQIKSSNTAREILDVLVRARADDVIDFVGRYAAEKYQNIAGLPVTIHLVNSNGSLLAVSGPHV